MGKNSRGYYLQLGTVGVVIPWIQAQVASLRESQISHKLPNSKP